MKTFGFPSMLFEENEKRDFLPSFFSDIAKFDIKIFLESGYGKKLRLTAEDYLSISPKIEFVSRKQAFASDIVTIIRTPKNNELDFMKKGATLFSMIHFVTHKNRCDFLVSKGIKMFAMDSVVDDFGKRMIEYMEGTAKNGIEAAVKLFLKNNPNKKEINFLILGTGLVGKTAADMAVHSTDIPVICKMIGRNATSKLDVLKNLARNTDILVDATYRLDTTSYIVPNEIIGYLPEKSVVLDLTADDYDEQTSPIQVKAIEGIPTGNLDKYVFEPSDEAFETIPKKVVNENRRLTLSCYSWPAIEPFQCLSVYQKQLLPFIKVLAEHNYQGISPQNEDFYVRSLGRGSYDSFINKF